MLPVGGVDRRILTIIVSTFAFVTALFCCFSLLKGLGVARELEWRGRAGKALSCGRTERAESRVQVERVMGKHKSEYGKKQATGTGRERSSCTKTESGRAMLCRMCKITEVELKREKRRIS